MFGHHHIVSLDYRQKNSRVPVDQSGKVANPARGQLNRENNYFPAPVRA